LLYKSKQHIHKVYLYQVLVHLAE